MICPQCGYSLSAFDKECPRCHGKGAPRPALPTSVPAPAPKAPVLIQMPESVPLLHILIAISLGFIVSYGVNSVLGHQARWGIALVSSVAVLIDAYDTEPRRVTGCLSMGPWGWFFGTLLLWPLVFPCYFLARPITKNT